MVVNELGKKTDFRFEQFPKAWLPSVVTELGITTLAKLLQPLKAE